MKHSQGTVCKSQDKTYIAVYNYYGDIYSSPSENMQGLERLAHVSYFKGKKEKGIDYFRLTDNRIVEEVIKKSKTIENRKDGVVIYFENQKQEDQIDQCPDIFSESVQENNQEEYSLPFDEEDFHFVKSKKKAAFYPNSTLTEVDKMYNIQYKLVNVPEQIKEDIQRFVKADVLDFCGEEVAPLNQERQRIITVDEIQAKTQLKRITPYQYLRGGKQWFIPECILEANIDFAQGCLSGFVPQNGTWAFDGKYFYNLFSQPTGECEYCYAEWTHKSFPKTIYKFDPVQLKKELQGEARLSFTEPNRFLGRPVKVLRFGKRTESWTPFTSNEFMQTLEICTEIGTRAVIPTKFLPYSPEIAALFKKNKSSIFYSVDHFEKMERGACAWGANNDFRLEQALKYKEDKVNVNLYFMIPGHHPPSQKEMEILQIADFGNKIPIQLLPVRTNSKELTEKMTGDKLEILLSRQKPFPGITSFEGSYVKKGKLFLLKKFDPFWTNLVKNSHGKVRICHHEDEHVYCGRCFQE